MFTPSSVFQHKQQHQLICIPITKVLLKQYTALPWRQVKTFQAHPNTLQNHPPSQTTKKGTT
uniref:Uncharacterized protein n=1 Tax=Anguilla anguilla TaxID=7936 RepID=A0A0E9VM96_ANGAN